LNPLHGRSARSGCRTPTRLRLLKRERAARGAALEEAPVGATTLSASGVPVYDEKRIREECWRAESTFFFQTQHGMYANGGSGDGIATGYTVVGRPNYWGEYTHGDFGYGRCTSKIYTNDKFAVDYPLASGDVIFSPFRRGKVTFAGRNNSHKDYGTLVAIRADNGKYVSLSAHLSGLARGIERGARVTDETIIGYAGETGGPDVPAGEPHLHQAYYRYPRYTPDGSPYGGAGLQVVYHRYVGIAAGTGPGVYKFGWTSDPATISKGDWISN
jgi:murein DD-endopeptidase MepM/ murein hydrolase activator NlpD